MNRDQTTACKHPPCEVCGALADTCEHSYHVTINGREIARPALIRLAKAYRRALKSGDDQFDFDGQTVLVGYAKYLIEYAESVVGKL